MKIKNKKGIQPEMNKIFELVE